MLIQKLMFVATPTGDYVNPATWQATDADTRGNHGLGSGRLALDFPFGD